MIPLNRILNEMVTGKGQVVQVPNQRPRRIMADFPIQPEGYALYSRKRFFFAKGVDQIHEGLLPFPADNHVNFRISF